MRREPAPSLDFDGGPEHDYLGLMDTTLDTWVANGFAVVQTDYQGLGTPGQVPYVNGVSEANNVVDIVRAARELDPTIGTDWVAMGHSQGGQAALFNAAAADKRVPELHLKGAVSIAPGGVNLGQTVEFVQSNQPGAEAAEPFLPVIVLGAAAGDFAIDPAKIFTPQFQPFVTAARTGCLDQLRGLTPIPPQQVFTDSPDIKTLTDYLAEQDPGTLTLRLPVMIAQGLADTTVSPAGTEALVKTYCDKHFDVDFKTYPGADHRASVAASLADAQTFVSDLLSGKPTPNTCTTP